MYEKFSQKSQLFYIKNFIIIRKLNGFKNNLLNSNKKKN